ncbi:hypothetical protein ASU31_22600 [Pedobacter ginsenosidimutans]|uniref:Uncharacterized protein n=1 Tax=Pedobacter ginsenosidimutans TaxID=687842 RepID=A0A0T5VKT9_9SPHI|nr:hypothetical protein [Pedobacter ginsenosidimutans]KRT13829.1 hypothetical protein ASU31_22600 [Pedobacter ginsenosidimutans]
MPYKNLALNYIRILQKYFPKFRMLAEENCEIITFVEHQETEAWIFEYFDKERDHDFSFKVFDFNYTINVGVKCSIEMLPYDPNKVTKTTFGVYIKDVEAHFINWISFVNAYNDLVLNSKDKIRNYYEDLYSADFEILDEDADSVPFELERQLLIEQFAILCIDVLNRDPESNRELIQDAIEIRDTVQNSTKKEIIRKISKFFAKIARKSLPLLKELASEAKKTIFKKAIEFGLKEIQEILIKGYHLLD